MTRRIVPPASRRQAPIVHLARSGIQKAQLRAAAVIRGGGVLVYPTDTIYGIGCAASSGEGLKRIAAMKGRGDGKPFLLLVDAPSSVTHLARAVTPVARLLMKEFWPGPLTLLLTARAQLPARLRSRQGLVGVRCPDDAFCRGLVRLSGGPVVSTSANLSGRPVPRTQDSLKRLLRDRVDLMVLGGRPSPMPSTIVDAHGKTAVVLREGAIPGRLIRACIGA